MKDTAYFLDIYKRFKARFDIFMEQSFNKEQKNYFEQCWEFEYKTGIEHQFEKTLLWRHTRNVCLDLSLLWETHSETPNMAFKEFIWAVDALYEIDVFKSIKGNNHLVLRTLLQARAFKDAEYETNERLPHLQAFTKRFSSISVCYTAYSSNDNGYSKHIG